MYETKPYFYGTGRRKDSVARVRVYQGTGKVTINDRDIDNYFGLETLKLIVRSPLVLLGLEGKYDVVVRVSGGGVSGQAGAIRHGLSRALLQQSDENHFPEQPVYVHFYSPRWICRMGNFRSLAEAQKMLAKVRSLGYRQACLVKGQITVQY